MDPLDTYRRSLTVREIISGITIVIVAIILLYLLWQILNTYIDPADKNPTQKKDFVQAFAVIVAGFVAFGTLLIGWHNLRHNQRTLLVSQQNTERTLDHTREIEDRRAQADTLQSYLEQIGKLILDNNLRTSPEGSEVRILAQAQTHTVLPTLAEERKRSVLIFLYKSNLLAVHEPSVGLREANFRGASLTVDLRAVNLQDVDFREADLSGANLLGAKVTDAQLEDTRSLQGATMPDGSKHP